MTAAAPAPIPVSSPLSADWNLAPLDGLSQVRGRQDATLSQATIGQFLQQAVQREGIALNVSLSCAALGLHVIMDGLIQNWLLDPEAFDLAKSGRDTMDVYLTGLGFTLPPPQSSRAPAPRTLAPA